MKPATPMNSDRRDQHGQEALEVQRDVLLGPHRADAGRDHEQAAEEQPQVRRRVDRVDADLEAVGAVPDEVDRAGDAERDQADDRHAVADRDQLQVGDHRLARMHAGGTGSARRARRPRSPSTVMPLYRNRCGSDQNDSWPVSLLWLRPSKNIATMPQIAIVIVIMSSRQVVTGRRPRAAEGALRASLSAIRCVGHSRRTLSARGF